MWLSKTSAFRPNLRKQIKKKNSNMSTSDYSFLFMYKLLNSTFMSLLEIPLLESSNSKADFIVLATNIEMLLSC